MRKQKNVNFRAAFTLIEVMVAVMIISVVIMALIEMYANNTHIFTSLKKQIKINQYSSLLISNDDFGFEDKSMHLDGLLIDFELESDLRRELKDTKVKIIYQELERIDMSEQDKEQDTEQEKELGSNMVLEIGRSILQIDNSSTALVRLRVQ